MNLKILIFTTQQNVSFLFYGSGAVFYLFAEYQRFMERLVIQHHRHYQHGYKFTVINAINWR